MSRIFITSMPKSKRCNNRLSVFTLLTLVLLLMVGTHAITTATISTELVLPTASGSPTSQVVIYNDRQYTSYDGTTHIVGEVYNNLEYTINQVSIKATLYSDTNEEIDVLSTGSLVRTISPGVKAPFDVIIEPAVFSASSAATTTTTTTTTTATTPTALNKKPPEMSHYKLDLNYKVSVPKHQVIEITDAQIIQDSLDNYRITGTITNNGEITANTVSVVATLYDKTGDVATVSKVYTEPDYLRSNEQIRFTIPIQDKIQAQSIADYSLIAESEEYAAVPEFPIGAGLLLVGTVTVFVVITRIPNRFIANLISVADPV